MTTDSAPSSPVDGSAQGGWWIILWGLAALAGVVVAWFAWRPASVCAGLALGGSISGFLAMFLARQRPPVDWARVATYTGLGAMSCVAVPAVAQVSGFIAAGLVLGVLGASPLGERAVRRARSATTRSGGTSASERQDPDQNPDHCSPIYAYIGRGLTGAQVAAMDTAAVCHAWRRSYRALEASRDAREKAEVVRVRQLYLDALHERNPPALEAWLQAGARAAGGPEKFFDRGLGDAA